MYSGKPLPAAAFNSWKTKYERDQYCVKITANPVWIIEWHKKVHEGFLLPPSLKSFFLWLENDIDPIG